MYPWWSSCWVMLAFLLVVQGGPSSQKLPSRSAFIPASGMPLQSGRFALPPSMPRFGSVLCPRWDLGAGPKRPAQSFTAAASTGADGGGLSAGSGDAKDTGDAETPLLGQDAVQPVAKQILESMQALRLDVGAIKGEQRAVRSSMEALQGEQRAMRSSMEALQGEQRAMRSSMEALQGDVGAMRSSVEALQMDLVGVKEDVTDVLKMQSAMWEGGVSKRMASILSVGGQQVVMNGAQVPHFTMDGASIVSFEPLLELIANQTKREDVRARISEALTKTYLNWKGEKAPLRQFECDCVASPAPLHAIGKAKAQVAIVSGEIKRSASLENIAKGLAQSCIVPTIFKWAANGILVESEEIHSICVVFFGQKLQEEKLGKIRHQQTGRNTSDIDIAIKLTKALLKSGEMVCCHEGPPCLSKRPEGFNSTVMELLKGFNIPDIPAPILDGNIENAFLPYRAIKDAHFNQDDSVAHRRFLAALSILASLRLASALQLGHIHIQQVQTKNAF